MINKINIYRTLESGVVVNKYTDYNRRIRYSVWEPGILFQTHTRLCSIEGKTYGTIESRELTPELDALTPNSNERSIAVRAYFKSLEEEAAAAIRAAYPEDFQEREETQVIDNMGIVW